MRRWLRDRANAQVDTLVFALLAWLAVHIGAAEPLLAMVLILPASAIAAIKKNDYIIIIHDSVIVKSEFS
jgi:hypothetical protein